MKDKKVKGNLLLKSIGFLLLPLVVFVLFSFLTYPIKPHCSLGNGISGCTSSCEPTSYFEDGRPASYKETPCFHDEPTTLQLSIFNQPWLIPLVLVVLMISIFFLICKRSFKQFLKDIVYIAFAPISLSKENRKNKNLISRIFVILILFFLIMEWLVGYYVVITTFKTAWEGAINKEQISYIEQAKPKKSNISPDNKRITTPTPTLKPRRLDGGRLFNLTNDYRKKNGLSELLWYHPLCEFAKARSQQIKEDWSHEGFQEEATEGALYISICPECGRTGENLAKGYYSEEAALQGWIKSPSHKENLDADWDWGCTMYYSNNYVSILFGKKK